MLGKKKPAGALSWPRRRFLCLQTQTVSSSRFCPIQPQMVFGPNLQHMAPFGVSTTAFCMVFQHATLIFSTTGPILGAQDLDLGSGWAGDLFGPKMGPEKRWFCGGNGPPWGFTGICNRGMDCMVPRRPLGKAVSSQTLPENHFLDLPGFRDRFGGRPGPPWWIPIVPLWANRPIGPVWGLRWCHLEKNDFLDCGQQLAEMRPSA